MGKRGPKPTPTEELAARGSWRARTADRALEVKVETLAETPASPSWLSEEAGAIWEEHAKAACDNGLLTACDLATFGMYCEALAAFVRHRDEAADVPYIETEKGVFPNPAIKARDEAAKLVLSYLREIGQSPASRVGLVLGKNAKKTVKPELKLFAKG